MNSTPQKQDWHKALIVAHLHMKGTSLRQLAAENELYPTALSVALIRPWPKAEGIIAHAIGVTPSEIWPARYAKRASKAANVEANKRRRSPLNETGDSIKECSHGCNIYGVQEVKHGL